MRRRAPSGKRLVAGVFAATFLAPVLLVAGLFARHASRYHGICEAEPLDVPARPCAYGEYLESFLGSWSILGMFYVGILAMMVVGTVSSAVALVVWSTSRREDVRTERARDDA
ncbi:MAG: hypothetical protein U0169_07055 [Polyangiaceae bacterium]